MTVMIPDHYAKTPSGERNFNELKADPHTDGWVALHSLNIAKHKTETEGECDGAHDSGAWHFDYQSKV